MPTETAFDAAQQAITPSVASPARSKNGNKGDHRMACLRLSFRPRWCPLSQGGLKLLSGEHFALVALASQRKHCVPSQEPTTRPKR
jgi:hypothetical protein